MSIRYVLIAKDQKYPLADYVADNGNYQLAIANLLPKLHPNRRKHFQSGECVVYTYCVDNLQFVCLTDMDYKIEPAYNFLEAVKQSLYKSISQSQIANAITLGTSMSKELKSIVDEYNSNPESDKAKLLISELAELKNTVAGNLSSLFIDIK